MREYRKGVFVCAGCGEPLFKSHMKYDSKTGWPSFFTAIADAIETKWIESCSRSARSITVPNAADIGHVFEDGNEPDKLALLQQ